MGIMSSLRRFYRLVLQPAQSKSVIIMNMRNVFYINPAETNKASTVKELCGSDYGFGNDQNDIQP